MFILFHCYICNAKRQTFRTACLTQIIKTQAEDLSNLFSNQATINSAAQKSAGSISPIPGSIIPEMVNART